jgi:hypothetical protein
MTIRGRIDHLNMMSATIAVRHHQLIALQQRVQELRRLSAAQEHVQIRPPEMFSRQVAVLNSTNEKVGQLFSGSNFSP